MLARVSAVFALKTVDSDDAIDGKITSQRLRELIHYVDEQATALACFEDIKPFVEQLDVNGMKYLAFDYKYAPTASEGAKDRAFAELLSMKLQYLLLTCPFTYTEVAGTKGGVTCSICSEGAETRWCTPCSAKLVDSATTLVGRLRSKDSWDPNLSVIPELCILIASCHIMTALPQPLWTSPRISSASAKHLLTALVVIESQLLQAGGHRQLELLATLLNLLVGATGQACLHWEKLGVKRTIVDSLAPIFYDRLSTMDPGLLTTNPKGWDLTDLLTSHYQTSLKLKMHKRLVDAFEEGNYSSALDIPRYMLNLRRSCTRVLSAVEETRGARASRSTGYPGANMLEDSLFGKPPFPCLVFKSRG